MRTFATLNKIVLRFFPPESFELAGTRKYKLGAEQSVVFHTVPKIGDLVEVVLKNGERCAMQIVGIRLSGVADGSLVIEWNSWTRASGEIVKAIRGSITTAPKLSGT